MYMYYVCAGSLAIAMNPNFHEVDRSVTSADEDRSTNWHCVSATLAHFLIESN